MIYYPRFTAEACTIFLIIASSGFAQGNWDNQLFTGNKVSWGGGQWKYSGEFQVRLLDNMSGLDRWFLEAVAVYMPSENWEVVPDLRFSVKPESPEWRPGLGGLYKILTEKFQFVNQLKWQGDYNTESSFAHGVRWAVFLNYILNETFIPNFVAGVFYRWREDFEGWEFLRFGAGVNIILSPVQSLNLSYFLGAANTGDEWSWSGIVYAQYSIRITDDWLYVPAKIINF